MIDNYIYGITATELLKQFVLAPVNHPEIIPTALPLLLGAFVIELYFGKHTSEELGWNTSVGNAVIWVATGVTLLMTNNLSVLERNAVYGLIGFGSFIGYMDFFHRWSPTIAFEISSAGIIYTLAYLLVVIIETDIPLGMKTLKAAVIFFLAANLGFKILQMFIHSDDNGIRFN
ncbi:MAG: hypothetical protein ABEJ99_01495 [Candidatus Nanohaloarchaea archaeon]